MQKAFVHTFDRSFWSMLLEPQEEKCRWLPPSSCMEFLSILYDPGLERADYFICGSKPCSRKVFSFSLVTVIHLTGERNEQKLWEYLIPFQHCCLIGTTTTVGEVFMRLFFYSSCRGSAEGPACNLSVLASAALQDLKVFFSGWLLTSAHDDCKHGAKLWPQVWGRLSSPCLANVSPRKHTKGI